ncbi:MAG: MATE family efflux transporter, partial [Clostridia bacterium]
IYFRIIMVGMLFTSMGLVINAAHRGTGNTKIAMITNIVANVVNCIFNYFLISGNWFFPKLGVEGAAIATLIGNVVSFAISLITVLKPGGFLRLKFSQCIKINKPVLKLIAKIGGSAGIEQIFMRIGFFVYCMIVNRLGTVAISTHTICMNILTLSFSVGDGLGIAASSLVGQNLGKKRSDLALLFGKVGQRIGFFVSGFLVLLFAFGGKILVSLFLTDYDPNAAEILIQGTMIMYIIAATSPAQISQVIFNGCLRGAGDTFFVAASSLLSIAIVRPLITYVLCYPLGLGLIGAWLSLIVDQYLRLVLSGYRFEGGKWGKIII